MIVQLHNGHSGAREAGTRNLEVTYIEIPGSVLSHRPGMTG